MACLQGAIYELKKADGKECGQLLKVLKFKAVLPITGNDIGAGSPLPSDATIGNSCF